MTDSEKLDLLLKKVGSIETKVDNLETKVDNLETKVDNLETKVDNLETDVRDTKMILENEIRVNIQRVAEGHLDLSRNMHEVMKPNNEIEMLAIKVRMLETDVRELKQRIS